MPELQVSECSRRLISFQKAVDAKFHGDRSIDFLRKWAHRLPIVRVGRRVFLDEAELDRRILAGDLLKNVANDPAV